MSDYLAASYRRREEIASYAASLRDNNGTVTSTWHDGHHELPGLLEQHHTAPYQAMCAKEDLWDLDKAGRLLFFSGGDTHRGGRHTEYGYALARGKTIVIIGPCENVFHQLADFQFDTFDDFMRWNLEYNPPIAAVDLYGNPL